MGRALAFWVVFCGRVLWSLSLWLGVFRDSSMFGRRCVPKVWAHDFHLFFRFFLEMADLGTVTMLSQRQKPDVWHCLMAAQPSSWFSEEWPTFACSNVLVVFVYFRLILGRDTCNGRTWKSPVFSGVLKDPPFNRPWDMISFGWVFVDATCFL